MLTHTYNAKQCSNPEPHGQHTWTEVGTGEGYVVPANDRHTYACLGRSA